MGEIVVIIVFALIVLGPDRLPAAGKQLGKALAEFRRVSSGVRADLQDALDVADLKDTVNEFRNVMDPRKMLADTLAPLDDNRHDTGPDSSRDKPLSADYDPATGFSGGISSASPPVRASVPSPDGAVVAPGLEQAPTTRPLVTRTVSHDSCRLIPDLLLRVVAR